MASGDLRIRWTPPPFHVTLCVLLQEKQRIGHAALWESGHSQSDAFPHSRNPYEGQLELTDSGAGQEAGELRTCGQEGARGSCGSE